MNAYEADKINEENLIVLNEEVSQYLEDDECFSSNTGNKTNSPFSKLSTSQTDFKYQEAGGNYINIIQTLTKTVKEKDNLIKNLNKNFIYLKDKVSEYEKISGQLNFQKKQNEELENELNLIKEDYLKLQDTMSNKEGLINEFQNLAEITKNKFQMFEEANLNLLEQNENLKRAIEEYEKVILPEMIEGDKSKDEIIEELKAKLLQTELKLEDTIDQLKKKEEVLSKQNDEKEIKLKIKYKNKEEHLRNEIIKEYSNYNQSLEDLKLHNQKLKIEIDRLNSIIENNESAFTDKDLEFKKVIESKSKEYEKLKKNLNDLKNDIFELESKYAQKQNEFEVNLKAHEESYFGLMQINLEKENKIKELTDENNNYSTFMFEIQNVIKEFDIKLIKKDEIIEKLKLENSKLTQKDITSVEQKLSDLAIKYSIVERNKQNLEKENETLKENLIKASERISELNDKIIDKYQGLELNFEKEKLYNKNIIKTYEGELISQNEINKLNIKQKNEEFNKMKSKYEKTYKTLNEIKCNVDHLVKNDFKHRKTIEDYKKIINEVDTNSDRRNTMPTSTFNKVKDYKI